MADVVKLHQDRTAHHDESGEKTATEPDESSLLEAERIAEALLFASAAPVPEDLIGRKIPAGVPVRALMERLALFYGPRGVNLMRIEDCWALRTAGDLSFLVHDEKVEVKKLSRAALEVLAIVAYHQPVTRAEIESIRGVATSKGTLDVLMEPGWVRLRGRRRSPGRPVTYGTTLEFLDHFGLEALSDLPGMEELKGAGLLSAQPPADFVPSPRDEDDDIGDDDPITHMDLEELGLLTPGGRDGDDDPGDR